LQKKFNLDKVKKRMLKIK